MRGRIESACPAGKYEEVLHPSAWTPDACKATRRIAEGEIFLNDILDYRTEMAVFLLETILIFLKKPLEIIKKQPVKLCVFRMTLAIDSCHSREDDS